MTFDVTNGNRLGLGQMLAQQLYRQYALARSVGLACLWDELSALLEATDVVRERAVYALNALRRCYAVVEADQGARSMGIVLPPLDDPGNARLLEASLAVVAMGDDSPVIERIQVLVAAMEQEPAKPARKPRVWERTRPTTPAKPRKRDACGKWLPREAVQEPAEMLPVEAMLVPLTVGEPDQVPTTPAEPEPQPVLLPISLPVLDLPDQQTSAL